jgi:energy-coupling factor transport system permease protein
VTGFVPTYRRTGSALHAVRPGIAIAYVAAPCLAALCFDHPLVLAAALIGVVGAGVGAGLGRELARAARFALPLALLVALINPLVSRDGLTVLVEGPVLPVLGPLDLTLEALTFGAIAGIRVLVLVLAFALYSAAVDPDEVLRLFRRLSFRSALTASLATRLLPVLGQDAERLGDAYGLRAGPVSEGRWGRLRKGAILTRALAAGALERALDLAATLEVRGYASAPRSLPTRDRSPWSRHDLAFGAAALAAVVLAVGGRLTGLAHFEPYPQLRAALGATDISLALALPAVLLSPFSILARKRARGGWRDG